MTIIGFVFLLALGAYFLASAIILAFSCKVLGGRVPLAPVVLFGIVGSVMLYFAAANSPFVITIAR